MSRFIGEDYIAVDYRRPPECHGPPVRDQDCVNGHLCQIDIMAVTRLCHHPLVIFCRECGTKIFEVVIYKGNPTDSGATESGRYKEKEMDTLSLTSCHTREG